MEEAGRKRKINETLGELFAGIGASGALFWFVFIWFVRDRISYSIGLWIGVLLAGFLAWHMWKTLDEALGLGVSGAEKVMRKQSLLRYALVIAVLAVLMYTDAADPLAAFLGIMTLKVAAYLQPVTHKVLSKIIRR